MVSPKKIPLTPGKFILLTFGAKILALIPLSYMENKLETQRHQQVQTKINVVKFCK